ncbi:NAD(P)/FAD-dependent oxidoreductase [Maricurvus nonylphenolicus]|uniref:flavin-dependent monooxygenase QhpG n=1 Tax=Maricurvus nonylphenolicus TaxID=1008307 RepID=UPI0036F35C8E
MKKQRIIVAGAGPAGTVTALKLSQLGYSVTVIALPRPFSACEGISERVLQGLQNAGLHKALATIAAPSRRNANWNGSNSEANTERLIRRDLFDQALLQSLQETGIDVINGRVNKVEVNVERCVVSGKDTHNLPIQLEGDFFVEARGRSTPSGKQPRMRGPETVSLLQHWQGDPVTAQSMATSFTDGWAWMAQFSDGSRYTQITVAADAKDFPSKSGLQEYFLKRLKQLPEALPFYQGATPRGELVARSSTAILTHNPIDDASIRIGDAALAVDPLSGNGIFQALSTALVAPAVINTILQKPHSKAIAQQFYRERVTHAFMRFARMGRDFYKMETRWPEQAFWQQRQTWPDQQPMHEPVVPQQVSVVERPVVKEDLIELEDVVITPDQPLGIWHLAGIALAPIVKDLQTQPLVDNETLASRLRAKGFDGPRLQALTSWLSDQGIA